MATKHNCDSQDPHYKEGRRMAIELKLDRVLAEARTSAVERKRARSGGDPPQTTKRDFLGRGKPRGRQGGRRQASAAGCILNYVNGGPNQIRTL
ncbi:hypothetical protein QQF64_000044 [Cirrhinus molitorella]|uniref:Uncharacterized protein n=1 Tax=Cirrhinus molitorella TaxID=172907 RepID=A0ABR3NXF6_9TELE